MQKIAGKSIELKNFSLIRKNSPIYYAENFDIADYGFGRVLEPANLGSKVLDEDTTNYSALKRIIGMDSVIEGSQKFGYFIDNDSQLSIARLESTLQGRFLKDLNDVSYFSDIKTIGDDKYNSIYFTTKTKVGRILRGGASGGSATTLVDTSGINFTDAGLKISEGDIVYNITDNTIATIDTGGIAANTLTITFSGGGSFANGEKYLIIDPDWGSLTDSDAIYGRQIIPFAEDLYILNGDYLALVALGTAAKDDTFAASHKKLERGYIARCGASTGNLICIGANKNHRGMLFFWDKFTIAWNNKMLLDSSVQAVVAYKNGFIYFSGNGIWFTDSYNKTLLTTIPGMGARDVGSYIQGAKKTEMTINPNGIEIVEDKLFINGGSNLRIALHRGMKIYDVKRDEWTYSPYEVKDAVAEKPRAGFMARSGMTFFDSYLNELYYSFDVVNCKGFTNQYILSRLKYGKQTTRDIDTEIPQSCVITTPIHLGKNAHIKKIEVSLVQDLRDSANVASKSVSIKCKLSNCTKPLWRYQMTRADSTSKNKMAVVGNSASYADAQIGDEVFELNGWNGFIRREITDISDSGSATEEWTLDSDLPELAKDDTQVAVLPFQSYGMLEKTVSGITEVLEFFPNFYGDNVMLELLVLGTTRFPKIAINRIKIYYE